MSRDSRRTEPSTTGEPPDSTPGDCAGGQATSDLAADGIDELADDVLVLLQMVRELSEGVADLRAQVAMALGQQRQQAADLHALRRDLIGERRTQANRSAFDAVHPAVDQIQLIRDALSDDEVVRYVPALLSTLRAVLRGLGFVPFSVDVGDPFDPARMECVEYADGEPGVVLAVLRPGYLADGVVARPCGVTIARPLARTAIEP